MTGEFIIKAKTAITPVGPGPLCGEDMLRIRKVRDAGIAVRDGFIAEVGPYDVVRKDNSGEIIDLGGRTLLPGLVDPHTHALFAGTRADEVVMRQEGWSYLEVLNAGGGILKTMRAVREAPAELLLSETISRLDRMLRHGTTTVEIKTGYDLRPEGELELLEIIKALETTHDMSIASTFLGAHAVPPEYDSPGEYIDDLIPIMGHVAEKANFCDVFCEQGVFELEDSRRLLETAKGEGLKLKLHADEIEPMGGAGLAAELGAVSADHLLASREEDLVRMAQAGVVAVLLPGTSYVLMKHGYADARRMIELGVPVALATDMNPNCWTESMQMVMSLAAYGLKMHPDEILTASTLNSAYALGVGDQAGSLEAGKVADIIAIDAPDHFHIPYMFGGNLVTNVFKAGTMVVRS